MDYERYKKLYRNTKWTQRKLCRSIKGGTIHKHTKCTKPEDSEARVLREVLQKATSLNILLFRQPAGRIFMGGYNINLAPKGAADLTGILPDGSGRRLEVECKKRAGGIQSADQKAWERRIESLGGVYLLVRSGKEFADKMKEYM